MQRDLCERFVKYTPAIEKEATAQENPVLFFLHILCICAKIFLEKRTTFVQNGEESR